MCEWTDAELEAYLDEALPVAAMARIEEAARQSSELRERLAAVNQARDAGVHSLAAIWRRHRISCPGREKWGAYLLGVLPADEADDLRFHLETVECRHCQANVADLRAQQAASPAESQVRRRRYFESSAG